MMRLFSQMTRRLIDTFISSLEMLNRQSSNRQIVDGIISRFIYALNRPLTYVGEDGPADSPSTPEARATVLGPVDGQGSFNPHAAGPGFGAGGWNDLPRAAAAATTLPVPVVLTSAAAGVRQEEEKVDRDLRDDMLKLVRYKVLFVKREYEHAFAEREDLVAENMDGAAFTAWKVAEFIQELGREPRTLVPEKWGQYPGGEYVEEAGGSSSGGGGRRRWLVGLPHEDKKYLRVYYEVLDRYPRERFKYEEQQVKVLEQIRDELRDD